jgi:hypothetical protein
MTSPLIALLMLGVAATTTPPATDPFTGTWKLNQAKSHLTGERWEVSAAGSNAWKFKYGPTSWTIKADGHDTEVFGATTALVAKSPRVWQFTDKVKGTVTGIEIWTLSADGNTMVQVTNGTRETGAHYTDTEREKRLAGSKGFAGTWETIAMKSSSPGIYFISATKSTLEVRNPESHTVLKCAYDGKPVVQTGPRATPDVTFACTRPAERTIHLVAYLKGKEIYTMDYSPSADGKTLTLTEHDEGQSQPEIAVYERR